ncbi:antA/AntB antirepressor family protein [Glutamicibacter ardleyensis]|uniref:antA/AntB antirepressor family protein n=1 Tax=Glutamicibacter ardleyensis TaxID=225894 RepID=UPI003FD53914
MTTQTFGMPPTPEESLMQHRTGELIPVTDYQGKTAVSLRDLYAFLEVSRDFTTWARQMFDYGFTEHEDYLEILLPQNGEQVHGGHNKRNWAVSLDMAKELSMIQRTEKGKQARQYFIEVEKQARAAAEIQLPKTYAQALRAHADEVEAHERTQALVAFLEPKASAWDDLCSSTGSLSFRDAAKVISEEGGITIGGDRLIKKLIEWGWCFRPTSTSEEKAKGKVRSIRAYQTQIDAETLTEKAKTYTDQKTGEKKLSNNPQTRVTGKGLDRIRARLRKEKASALLPS